MVNQSLSNPAERLYLILNAVWLMDEPNAPMKAVWASIASSEPSDATATVHYVTEVLQLVKECQKIAEQIPDVDRALYLEPFLRIEEAFVELNLLEGPLEGFRSRIGDATMIELRYCSDRFSTEVGEELIRADVLLDLQFDIADVLETVIGADIDDELKKGLIHALENIRRAILEYRIRGADGLRQALDAGIGALYRYRQEIGAIEDLAGC